MPNGPAIVAYKAMGKSLLFEQLLIKQVIAEPHRCNGPDTPDACLILGRGLKAATVTAIAPVALWQPDTTKANVVIPVPGRQPTNRSQSKALTTIKSTRVRISEVR